MDAAGLARGEIVRVLFRKERGGSDDQRVRFHRQKPLFHTRLAAAIDAQRRWWVVFPIRLSCATVEDEVA
jgi:hypothetical protein